MGTASSTNCYARAAYFHASSFKFKQGRGRPGPYGTSLSNLTTTIIKDEYGRLGIPFTLGKNNLLFFHVEIEGCFFPAYLDTGGSHAFMDRLAYAALCERNEKIKSRGLKATNVTRVQCANGTWQPVDGAFETNLTIGPLELKGELHVVDGQPIALLIGGDVLSASGICIDYERRLLFAYPNQGWLKQIGTKNIENNQVSTLANLNFGANVNERNAFSWHRAAAAAPNNHCLSGGGLELGRYLGADEYGGGGKSTRYSGTSPRSQLKVADTRTGDQSRAGPEPRIELSRPRDACLTRSVPNDVEPGSSAPSQPQPAFNTRVGDRRAHVEVRSNTNTHAKTNEVTSIRTREPEKRLAFANSAPIFPVSTSVLPPTSFLKLNNTFKPLSFAATTATVTQKSEMRTASASGAPIFPVSTHVLSNKTPIFPNLMLNNHTQALITNSTANLSIVSQKNTVEKLVKNSKK
jgi:hypothetical protein